MAPSDEHWGAGVRETEVRAALPKTLEAAAAASWAQLAMSLDECLATAASLGLDIVPTRRHDLPIGELRAVPREADHPRSLSAVVGLAPMPLHTDGAHLPHPPDFVLLEVAESLTHEDVLLWPVDDDRLAP